MLKSTMKTKLNSRLYVVGDVHGCLDKLLKLQKAIQEDATSFSGPTHLVYIGDYIDRGLYSKQVIENLCTPLLNIDTVDYILGNHDKNLRDLLEENFERDEADYLNWIFKYGGDATLMSYGVHPKQSSTLTEIARHMQESVPEHHQQFLKDLKPYIEIGEFLCVHGGIDPKLPLEEHDIQTLTFTRPPTFENHGWDKIVMFGHTIFDEPLIEHDRVGVDTGAYTGNP